MSGSGVLNLLLFVSFLSTVVNLHNVSVDFSLSGQEPLVKDNTKFTLHNFELKKVKFHFEIS